MGEPLLGFPVAAAPDRPQLAAALLVAAFCVEVATSPVVGGGVHDGRRRPLPARAAALYQRDQRRRRTGPRHSGARALAVWPLSLTPIAGIGASLSWMAALPVLDAMQWRSCSP